LDTNFPANQLIGTIKTKYNHKQVTVPV